jgi:hypothetical protein
MARLDRWSDLSEAHASGVQSGSIVFAIFIFEDRSISVGMQFRASLLDPVLGIIGLMMRIFAATRA